MEDFFEHIEFNKGLPGKGKLLISEPFMGDYNFKRTVVLLTEHSRDQGTVGFVLNRKSPLSLDDIYPELTVKDIPIYIGGPVGRDLLFFIHRFGEEIENAKQIEEDLYWGGDIKQVKELLLNSQFNLNDVRFFAGYSGWSAGQLEQELTDHSWILAKLKGRLNFSDHDEFYWKKTLAGMGKHYKIMANFPDDPSKN